MADVLRGELVPVARAVRWIRSLAEAVHFAHGQGILHRDLKPSNILIDPLDQPQITDFGIAKDLRAETELTLSSQALGSPNDMPPEQCGRVRQISSEANSEATTSVSPPEPTKWLRRLASETTSLETEQTEPERRLRLDGVAWEKTHCRDGRYTRRSFFPNG